MRIDFANGTIEVTKTEAKKASIPGSAAYKALMEYRMENPTFKVAVLPTVTKKIGKKNKITYTDIERYISFHDDENGSIMKEYKARRNPKQNGELYGTVNFFEIKKWFFKTFPEVA